MAQGGYVIVNWFRPHADQAKAFETRMREDARRVRAGGGVRQYEFHTSAETGTEFLLYEEFASHDDWQAHHGGEGSVTLRAAIKPMLDGHKRSVWTQVAGLVNQDAPPGHSTFVRFRMEPESVEPMVAEMRNDVAAASGMLRFDLNAGAEDPGAFVICARWASRDAWQAHQSKPDYLAFRERTAGFYATKPDRTLWRPLR